MLGAGVLAVLERLSACFTHGGSASRLANVRGLIRRYRYIAKSPASRRVRMWCRMVASSQLVSIAQERVVNPLVANLPHRTQDFTLATGGIPCYTLGKFACETNGFP